MKTIPTISRNHVIPRSGFQGLPCDGNDELTGGGSGIGRKNHFAERPANRTRMAVASGRRPGNFSKIICMTIFLKSADGHGPECLPTILPCQWRGQNLPDHGEVWSTAWDVNEAAWDVGILRTTVRLKISPFELTRTIELAGNEIRIDYELVILSPTDEPFLWAFHPLLRLMAGDALELPASTRAT